MQWNEPALSSNLLDPTSNLIWIIYCKAELWIHLFICFTYFQEDDRKLLQEIAKDGEGRAEVVEQLVDEVFAFNGRSVVMCAYALLQWNKSLTRDCATDVFLWSFRRIQDVF